MFKTKQIKIIFLAICFFGGIVLTNILAIHISVFYLILPVPLLIMVWRQKEFYYILGFVFFLAGGWWLNYSYPDTNADHITYYNNLPNQSFSFMNEVEITGVVVDEPDIRIDHIKLLIAVNEVDNRATKGNVLVKTDLYPGYNYGDKLWLSCKLIKPDKIEAFAYDDYLSLRNIYSLCYSPRIKLLATQQGSKFKTAILFWKDKLHNIIKQNLTEPSASLLSAILLARKRGLPDTLINDFSKAGVSHIIAISGMHISIIAMLIVKLLSFFYLPKKYSYPLAAAILMVYIIMVGSPASAVRAGIMGLIVLLADYYGRLNKSYFILTLVAFSMVIINPKIILFDLGFQLSFLAVMSLIFFSETMDDWFTKWPKFGGATSILKTTLVAQVLTLPWLVYKFGFISLVAPLANIVLLPILPMVLTMSIIAIAISFVYLPVAQILFWLLWYLLNRSIAAISWLANLDFAIINFSNVSIWLIVVCYLIIIFLKKIPRCFYTTGKN